LLNNALFQKPASDTEMSRHVHRVTAMAMLPKIFCVYVTCDHVTKMSHLFLCLREISAQTLNPYLGKLLALFVHLLAEEKCSALFDDAVSAFHAWC
jgi:hypothetical protein